jgi:hypothetical protein
MSDQIPQIGQQVYVPSAFYIDHGRDDFAGGLATIIEVVLRGTGRYYVTVAENPHCQYSWEYLRDSQEEWAKEYGEGRAHPDPDLHPDSNPPNYGW